MLRKRGHPERASLLPLQRCLPWVTWGVAIKSRDSRMPWPVFVCVWSSQKGLGPKGCVVDQDTHTAAACGLPSDDDMMRANSSIEPLHPLVERQIIQNRTEFGSGVCAFWLVTVTGSVQVLLCVVMRGSRIPESHRSNSEFFSTPLNPQFLFQQTRFKQTGNQRFRRRCILKIVFPPFSRMCVCVCVCLVCAAPALHPEWFDLTENPVVQPARSSSRGVADAAASRILPPVAHLQDMPLLV